MSTLSDQGIKITEEMIKAGLEFLHDEGFPMLTARAESYEFVEDFLLAVFRDGRKDELKE